MTSSSRDDVKTCAAPLLPLAPLPALSRRRSCQFDIPPLFDDSCISGHDGGGDSPFSGSIQPSLLPPPPDTPLSNSSNNLVVNTKDYEYQRRFSPQGFRDTENGAREPENDESVPGIEEEVSEEANGVDGESGRGSSRN